MKYSIKRTGGAIGDHMMAAFFVQLLNDNGIEAVYGTHCYRDLVAVPLSEEGESYHEYTFFYHEGVLQRPTFHPTKTIIEIATERFQQQFDITQSLEVKTPYVPVKFVENNAIPKVDVVLCTKSGVWTRYRNWPYFPQLKRKLEEQGISYVDLTEQNIQNNDCLNYVHKAKLYIGLETGVSHYVSQVVNRALILQSGYSSIDFWCPYHYDYLAEDVACKKCFIHCKTRPYQCQYRHQCMQNISVDQVMHKIQEWL